MAIHLTLGHTHKHSQRKGNNMSTTNHSLVHTPPNPPGGGAQREGESPRNPFSISAILSDEVGQKRSPTSSSVTPPLFSTFTTPLSRDNRQRHRSQETSSSERSNLFLTPNRPSHSSSNGETWGAHTDRPSRLSLSEVGGLAVSPTTTGGLANGKLA